MAITPNMLKDAENTVSSKCPNWSLNIRIVSHPEDKIPGTPLRKASRFNDDPRYESNDINEDDPHGYENSFGVNNNGVTRNDVLLERTQTFFGQ